MRSARATAARDHALILFLGDMGLRSHEARSLLSASIHARRVDGLKPWLTVIGKGDKVRRLPIPTDVDEALLRWQRERPPELADDPLLFPPPVGLVLPTDKGREIEKRVTRTGWVAVPPSLAAALAFEVHARVWSRSRRMLVDEGTAKLSVSYFPRPRDRTRTRPDH
jgi:site-specific recombinase XerC